VPRRRVVGVPSVASSADGTLSSTGTSVATAWGASVASATSAWSSVPSVGVAPRRLRVAARRRVVAGFGSSGTVSSLLRVSLGGADSAALSPLRPFRNESHFSDSYVVSSM
jgi:hypothetical protein